MDFCNKATTADNAQHVTKASKIIEKREEKVANPFANIVLVTKDMKPPSFEFYNKATTAGNILNF